MFAVALLVAIAGRAETTGTVVVSRAASPALRSPIEYRMYCPPGYDASGATRYPVLYLLHGRGDRMTAWATVLPVLDRMITTERIPPVIAIMPDASSSHRAGYYIDSQFTGAQAPPLPPGENVETAFTRDLIAHVDEVYPTQRNRAGRIVAGYSMGGYGALRYALAHPEFYGAAIVLSPAVYVPLPPKNSSARSFGAFGRGSEVFSAEIYTALNYPATTAGFEAKNLPLTLFIGVGDDEIAHADLQEAVHDLDYEAHTLYNRLRRTKTVAAELRVINGGHEWEVWRPLFVEGLEHVFRSLKTDLSPTVRR